jgi:hypothetical protein
VHRSLLYSTRASVEPIPNTPGQTGSKITAAYGLAHGAPACQEHNTKARKTDISVRPATQTLSGILITQWYGLWQLTVPDELVDLRLLAPRAYVLVVDGRHQHRGLAHHVRKHTADVRARSGSHVAQWSDVPQAMAWHANRPAIPLPRDVPRAWSSRPKRIKASNKLHSPSRF